jgi:glutamyl-tRNA synthetase
MTAARVRIAPSPTGDPHVGTAYIGLFNMALARSQGGAFVLRVEDTDRVRSTPESEQGIMTFLRWVGLEWDEGPDVGGDYGPYRQSERTEIYREHVDLLVQKGSAYPCFCTSERLTELRAEQRAAGGMIGYDRHCRELAPEEATARINAGESYVVRMKMPVDGETIIHDELRGAIHYENKQIDDQVLLKSDGFPTYHLANVVDDHLMEISHVIRAEEWIPSTPKHVVLYEAFGWEMPKFLHLSLLRNSDKSKISKRKNPVSLEWFKQAGFLPEALLNFLGLMGYSMTDDREQFSFDEMLAEFDTNRLTVSEPVFDMAKLEWLNGQWMRAIGQDDLKKQIQEFIFNEKMDQIMPLIQERLHRLDGFMDTVSYFFQMDVPFDPQAFPIKRWPTKETDGESPKAPFRAMNKAFKQILSDVESMKSFDDPDALEAYFREFCEKSGWKTKELFMAMRFAMTGRKASPPLFDTMIVLGKPRVQYRLRKAMEAFRGLISR